MEGKLLYRVAEAAECLGLSRSKVYGLMQSGQLRSVKIDGARRVVAEDLRSYVETLSGAA